MRFTSMLRLVKLFVAWVLIPVLLVACGNSNLATQSNADLLKDAAANMRAAKSYHIEADITQHVLGSAGQDDTTRTSSADIDITSQSMRLEVSFGTNPDTKIENSRTEIRVGNNVYSSFDGGETFQEDEFGDWNSRSVPDFWAKFTPEEIRKVAEALQDGTPANEDIDGVATWHITSKAAEVKSLMPDDSSQSLDGTIEMWISTDAIPYVRQLRLKGENDGEQIHMTVKWSDFDKQFDIKAPNTDAMPDVPTSTVNK